MGADTSLMSRVSILKSLFSSTSFVSITESEVEPLQAQLAELELEISEMVGRP